MKERAILTFRVDSACYFRNQYFKATDEEGGTTHQFPFGSLLHVPQHFTLLDEEGNVDEELQGLRTKFFDWSLPILAGSTPLNAAELIAKVEAAKANFLAFGQAEAPKPAKAPVPEVPPKPAAGAEPADELEKMTVTNLQVKLDELKVDYTSSDSKSVLVAKLREALAKPAATNESGNP